jgi:hypothetical protein
MAAVFCYCPNSTATAAPIVVLARARAGLLPPAAAQLLDDVDPAHHLHKVKHLRTVHMINDYKANKTQIAQQQVGSAARS